jgi:hypothetical protein
LQSGLDKASHGERSDLPVGLRVDERTAIQLSLNLNRLIFVHRVVALQKPFAEIF